MRYLLFGVAVLLWPPAFAQDPAELVALVNAYRSAPRDCEGRRMAAAGPLAPDARLDGVNTVSGERLQAQLRARGYPASHAYAMGLSGPAGAAAAMSLMTRRFCARLLDPRYSHVGVAREGRNWRVVLAHPLLSPALGEWRQAGEEVLRRVNAARRQERNCGARHFGAAPPLRWAAELGLAAFMHSRDMATRNYFAHRAPDGSRADARAQRQGYRWRRVGENIAAGQGSPQQVVDAWLASPPHCENLMNRGFAEMGAAYAVNERSDSTIYWTQVLGTRR